MNRRAFVAGGLASVALPGLAVAKKGKPKYRTRTVTKTFRSKGLISINKTLGDSPNPYPTRLRVKGFPKGKIKKVEVRLYGLTHQRPNEIQMLLHSPGGRKTLLMRYAGRSNAVTNLNLVLKQNAPKTLPDGNAAGTLPSGTYKPAAYLALQPFPAPAPQGVNAANLNAFKNSKPNGFWKLYVHDVAKNGHYGEIKHGWSLRITAQVKQKVK